MAIDTLEFNNQSGDEKWGTEENWAGEEIPTANDNIRIGMDCHIDCAAVCNIIFLRSGFKLIKDEGGSLDFAEIREW